MGEISKQNSTNNLKSLSFKAKNCSRLDTFISAHLGSLSRASIAAAIKNGFALINDKTITKASYKVKLGDKISFSYYDGSASAHTDSKLALDSSEILPPFLEPEILYEDDDILVLNKPSGLVVHSAPSLQGEPTLLEWLKHSGRELSTSLGEHRAGIVHRLDRGTSGAMVVAKNNYSSASLSKQLAAKTAQRIYLALCDLPLKENCIINKMIARCEANRLKKAIAKPGQSGARSAKSAFSNIYLNDDLNTLKQSGEQSYHLIAAKLFSGRTHQIRVHLASINRHILGDALYGFKHSTAKITRVFLHAYILELIHPRSLEKMRFIAPLPQEFYEKLNITKEIVDEKIKPSDISSVFNGCNEWLCHD